MGRHDVDVLLGEMPSASWAEWSDYLDLEPQGGLRDDLRFALVVAAVYNNNPYRDGRPVKLGDVFRSLKHLDQEPVQDVHKVVRMRKIAAAAHNAAIAKGQVKVFTPPASKGP